MRICEVSPVSYTFSQAFSHTASQLYSHTFSQAYSHTASPLCSGAYLCWRLLETIQLEPAAAVGEDGRERGQNAENEKQEGEGGGRKDGGGNTVDCANLVKVKKEMVG